MLPPGIAGRTRRACAMVLALALALCCARSALALDREEARPDDRDGELRRAGMVEPTLLDSTIRLDMRYATTDNFTGVQVYPSARCYLRADIARRVVAAHRSLRRKGLGLKLFDCYRPFSVQEAFWKIMPDERYVLEPRRENGMMVKSSRHNRGAAVDASLVDRKGRELAMPTAFDDFTEKAHRDSQAASPEARRNSAVLERAMAAQGFVGLPTEWWHFDGPGWEACEPLDLPLPQK